MTDYLNHSLHCNMCGKAVFKEKGDYFMLHNDLWDTLCCKGQIGKHWVLCRNCAERILERPLQREDLQDIAMNYEVEV